MKSIKDYTEKMKEEEITRAIIVVQEDVTAFAKTHITVDLSDFAIEIFKESELLVNITKHILVPRHTPLSDDEKKAVLQR